MPVIYLENKKLELFVLISYTLSRDKATLSLNSINFFASETDILNHIKKNKLVLATESNSPENELLKKVIELIKAYLSGKKVNLYEKIHELGIELSVDEKFPTLFSQRVIHYLLENVNYGESITYSKIGKHLNTKAYRAIGNVMKKNPLPLIIPCHRVIRKNGTLGGFMGEANESWQTNLKLNLLKIEGIK